MILRRYIQKEIVEKLGWILGLLLLILTSNRFVDYLSDAAAGQLPSELIFQMLMMKMLATLPKLMPIAVFIAVILGMSRLTRDKEITIIRSSGMTFRFQFMSVLQFAFVFSCIVFIVGFYIAPWAEQNVGLLKERARSESDITGMKAGKFKEFSEGDRMVYVERLSADEEYMQNVFLQVRQDNNLGVLNSSSAKYEFTERSGSRYILFKDGRRYIGSPGELNYQITRYRTYAVLIDEGNAGVVHSKLEAVPSASLFNSDNPKYVAELQWRISLVLSTLLLPLLAVALSRYSFSDQRYLPIFVCIAIYFIYSNLLGVSKTLLKRDDISSYLGLWWVHLLLVAITLFLFYLPDLKKAIFNRGSSQQLLPAEE